VGEPSAPDVKEAVELVLTQKDPKVPIRGTRPLSTRLCLLPSPIEGYAIYAIMGILSMVCIILSHVSCRKNTSQVQYIELDRIPKDQEMQGGERRSILNNDIRGILKDSISLFIFVLVCNIIQITIFS
jgi:hypothetical protein